MRSPFLVAVLFVASCAAPNQEIQKETHELAEIAGAEEALNRERKKAADSPPSCADLLRTYQSFAAACLLEKAEAERQGRACSPSICPECAKQDQAAAKARLYSCL